ncbi:MULTISPECIES: LPS export ABC transporter permease LptG [Brevundimonas]|uniref:LPS export ABC transporter permease LptG n=1 Tax=Brevundimonas TaxID=41275 RepID=UPI001907D750|nr:MULTISPECIES: LPS export ABC transporter permease LptG [Brevundimonas]MBK1968967.1 LPS export ABC transporter permease LptG [Brevundimonas diminuta]MBK1975126.1 LPS export ABC transporter permease LptG [Brevundimonas diminuta]MDA0743460.1 LPS export ABC transporter permease LptG [Pseudomonadota bacterium]MDM8351556.1 LPS export ABC transporter permease LptG [Brevundimonas diminuta]
MKLRLGRIERYVLIQQMKSLGVALAVIAALVMLIDFVEVSRGLNSSGELSSARILGLVLVKSPSVVIQLLPFVFLFGTLGAFVSLNRRSELIAMRAAGVSAWRFVLPAAGAAVLMGALTVTVLGPMAAAGDGIWQRERGRISGSVPGGETAESVWLREGDENRQMIIRGGRQEQATGRLLDPTFFIYTTTSGGRRVFTERIDAATAALNAGRWRLTDARGAQTGQRAVRYATLDLPSNLADKEAFQRFARPQSTPFWSLPNQIRRIEDAGFASTAYRLRLQQLLATPLVFGAMSILAAAFSLRLMRLGDLARMTVAAVVLGFAFFFLNQFSSAMGSAEVVPPIIAAWLPPVLTALAAFTLLFYTEDG